MNNAQLIAQIKATKGPIHAVVLCGFGALYVQVVKADLVFQLSAFPEEEASYTLINMDDGTVSFQGI